MRAQLVVIAAWLCLAGCASTTGPTSFPADWGSIRSAPTSDGCPALAGLYGNQSAATYPVAPTPPWSLGDIFTRMGQGQGPASPGASNRTWPAIPGDAVSVSIEQQPEALKVTFANEQGDRTSLDFRRHRFDWAEERYDDLFNCYLAADEPRLGFMAQPESRGSASMIGVEGGGTLVMLLKAVDGSLIVQWRSESIVLWIGVVGSEIKVDSVWFRFPPLVRQVRSVAGPRRGGWRARLRRHATGIRASAAPRRHLRAAASGAECAGAPRSMPLPRRRPAPPGKAP